MARLRSYLRPLKWPWRLFFSQHDRTDYGAQAISVGIAALHGASSMVRHSWPGAVDIEKAKDFAVFVHYDTKGKVHDFHIEHIRALKAAGRAVIFVSNSPEFPDSEREKAAPHCALIAWRRNRGYDFGAYRDGVLLIPDYEAARSVLLINDSVYGPFQDLKPLFKRMDAKTADIWGLTDNWDTKWHLQSYFLLFHEAALKSDAVRALWRDWKHVQSKSWVINKLEIGLTGRFQKAGLKCAALWPYRDEVTRFCDTVKDRKLLEDENLSEGHRELLGRILELADAGAPMNPCHFFWDQLIADGFPYMKREVLTANPIGMPRLYEWSRVIEQASGYDAGLVERHLRAILKNRVI